MLREPRATNAFLLQRVWEGGPPRSATRGRSAPSHGKRRAAGWAQHVEREVAWAACRGLREGGRNRAVRRRCAGAVASRSAPSRRGRNAHHGAGRWGGALGRPRQAWIVGRRAAAADG